MTNTENPTAQAMWIIRNGWTAEHVLRPDTWRFLGVEYIETLCSRILRVDEIQAPSTRGNRCQTCLNRIDPVTSRIQKK